MTSNRPIEDWDKLLGDVPSATAILDRFLQRAEIITTYVHGRVLHAQEPCLQERREEG